MSDRAPLARAVVFAHGGIAQALVSAVEDITGIEDALVPISNDTESASVLRKRVLDAVSEGPTIVFTDLKNSSCSFAASGVAAGDSSVAVLCGTNLPMLLDFVFHRELPLEELVPRLLRHGRDGVAALMDDRGGSA